MTLTATTEIIHHLFSDAAPWPALRRYVRDMAIYPEAIEKLVVEPGGDAAIIRLELSTGYLHSVTIPLNAGLAASLREGSAS